MFRCALRRRIPVRVTDPEVIRPLIVANRKLLCLRANIQESRVAVVTQIELTQLIGIRVKTVLVLRRREVASRPR